MPQLSSVIHIGRHSISFAFLTFKTLNRLQDKNTLKVVLDSDQWKFQLFIDDDLKDNKLQDYQNCSDNHMHKHMNRFTSVIWPVDFS